MQNYPAQDRLLLAVDCIIFGFQEDQLNLLLIRRDFEPHRGEWSLMGGFLRRAENLDAGAQRVVKDLTGLQDVYLEQFHTFGKVGRDSVERTISVGYYALVNQKRATAQLSERYAARWTPLTELPPLIFDHQEMVDAALAALRYRATHEPVGFELLPEKFTLTQLQRLYEAIFDQPIDAGNFRRRLRKMDYLEQTDEKDFSESRRGAWYYQFLPDQYADARRNGIPFLLKP
ncbi:NUDIX domain-containing protein [Lewinella sp. W8]|uniref:NUDIX hydrolase n=1 Tax=Lewinella sp. W8 TaxID=2528208 RepID=UPI0010682CF8|nr:NUDIX domain-containing protein [Lewinella sp. W8]MTB50430.1 NUDIX domain-containing protein [Lewinella sp. W8]